MAFVFASHVKTIELKGSAAQVKWAENIRAQRAGDLQKLGTAGMAKALRGLIAPEDLERISATTPERCAALISAIAVHSLSCPDAAWWVANRNEKAETRLESSARTVIDHYIEKGVKWRDDDADAPPW